jgi:hypothetical protein
MLVQAWTEHHSLAMLLLLLLLLMMLMQHLQLVGVLMCG